MKFVFDRFYSREQLFQLISVFAKKSVESRQVSSRLRKLLPERLGEIKRLHQKDVRASKASRLALCDQRYRSFVREYVDLKEEALTSRIQWETHRMYYYSKKTRS